ncbi:MAG: hypothetical protein IKZ25_03380 [Clostridia bacterium]|nr:hypothetical protein [Clostridia bacterium]
MKYKIKKQGFFKEIPRIFGINKIKITERKISKPTPFYKGFLITFIPLFVFLSAALFYKTDKSIKSLTGNYKDDIFFTVENHKTALSITILNENITIKIP